jgi:hypothetical protein
MKSNKTKEQIIDAYENRIVLKFIAGIVLVGGIALTIILSGNSSRALTTTVLAVSFVTAIILTVLAIRCPLCDSLKSPGYAEFGIIHVKTGFFRCEKCNLSNGQVREYVDLLRRGVDIDKAVIARLSRRNL